MHLDKYGLPVQADGDANDQLHRCGMIMAGVHLDGKWEAVEPAIGNCLNALVFELQPETGVYVRHVNGNYKNVSCDQLIPVLAYWIVSGDRTQSWNMFKAMCKRFGFAQNTVDGLNGDDTTRKVPDFMALRTTSLFCRMHWVLYPLAVVLDLTLILFALAASLPVVWRDNLTLPAKRSANDVDDNNVVVTLVTCRARMPTPFSILACWLYGRLRPWNYGCQYMANNGGFLVMDAYRYHPVYGSLRWYHRAEAGGNPEIAELWRPLCAKYFEPTKPE